MHGTWPDLTESDGTARSIVAAARQAAAAAADRAPATDRDDGFPVDDVANLGRLGLLAAPLPRASGGVGLGEAEAAATLLEVLRLVGYGSLALGRIYEGHVNALQLVLRYGTAGQHARLFADSRDGHLFGVWNTESREGLALVQTADGRALRGGKTFASGAGFVSRALVTARPAPGEPPLMLVVALDRGERADLSAWRAHGMRASATGTVDLTGLPVTQADILGGPDDYHAEPHFSGGAWRFAAVQLGGIEAVLDAWRSHLRQTGRGEDPHQLARLGAGAGAAETARLWVARAAERVAAGAEEPARTVAYVNLARLAVERAGLDVLEMAQRSVGLQGFLRDHPLERLGRDLATYLRQPAPDRALTLAARHVLDESRPAGDLWAAGPGT
ncbi:acyl-CoA dehydrogenase family protein [Methylobacterium durans]|uniref:acyl-CoA dehydrogenase family protein n=1 Tax=Methylobacterium durans TaxID=2202825 RepID=UPI002AFE4521|nr:acyl-CoA dehydrogenase family protein [Methylobacterium durans]MEA1831379.1 acyl-CoA dehydrogenase family protein [Methylobacterium durans]